MRRRPTCPKPVTSCACGGATQPRWRPWGRNRAVVNDAAGVRAVPLAGASAAIGEAIRDAELIVIPAPATAQDDIARALAPHLEDGQVVFLPPGSFGSYVMAQIVRRAGSTGTASPGPRPARCPISHRKHGEREVNVTVRAVRLPTGVYPAGERGARARRDPARLPERPPRAATRSRAR